MDYYRMTYPAIYRGKVESNQDPLNVGRCRIRILSVHGNFPTEILPWAVPVSTSPVNQYKGSFNIPEVGDIVWVMFEGADKNFPVYIGGTHAVQDIPIDMDKVTIYTEDYNSIVYDRKEKSYKFNVGNNSIKISSEGIHIEGNLVVDGNVSIKENLSVDGDYPSKEV